MIQVGLLLAAFAPFSVSVVGIFYTINTSALFSRTIFTSNTSLPLIHFFEENGVFTGVYLKLSG